jgi:hypothetical protein
VSEAEYAVVLVYSTSHALRAEKLLLDGSVECKLIPVPRQLSSDCGVCVRIPRHESERALEILAAQVMIEGVHDT